jgi:hypothetical protein
MVFTACTSSAQDTAPTAPDVGGDIRGTGPDAPDQSPSPGSTGAGSTDNPGTGQPPANPADVPGAERLGISPADNLCAAAPKIAASLVGVLDAAYAHDPARLQTQVEDATVGSQVLRAVAPADLQPDVEAAASFLASFRDHLVAFGFDLDAASRADPAFFGGPDADSGFRAITATLAGLEQACGVTF